MLKRLLILIIVPICLIFIRCNKESKHIENKVISVKTVLNLGNLTPPLFNFVMDAQRVFDIDENGIFYFLDSQKHRILKYSKLGQSIGQIGSIGQDESGIFYPSAIKISGNVIYIGDKGGKKIKLFSLNGDFINGFNIDKSHKLNWLDVEGDRIFANVRYVTPDTFNKNKLISVFDKKGLKKGEFGKILESQSIYGYFSFNTSYFYVIDEGNIIGTFKFYPFIFNIKSEGSQVYFKNISTLSPEFQYKWNLSQSGDSDRPDKIRIGDSSGPITMINFCEGFAVDAEKNIYYAINTSTSKGTVFRFDKNGNIIEKLILKSTEGVMNVVYLFIDKYTNTRYGIGDIIGNIPKTILFKF